MYYYYSQVLSKDSWASFHATGRVPRLRIWEEPFRAGQLRIHRISSRGQRNREDVRMNEPSMNGLRSMYWGYSRQTSQRESSKLPNRGGTRRQYLTSALALQTYVQCERTAQMLTDWSQWRSWSNHIQAQGWRITWSVFPYTQSCVGKIAHRLAWGLGQVLGWTRHRPLGRGDVKLFASLWRRPIP